MSKSFYGPMAILAFCLVSVLVAVRSPISLQAEETISTSYFPIVQRSFAPLLETYVQGIAPPATPTDIIDPGDGRFFIATRDGRIQIISSEGELQPDLLLDIRERVYDDGNEAGLVGLAAHPQFASNGFLYVHYNERIVDQQAQSETLYSVIARYSVGANGYADASSEKRLLQIELPTPRHHGGAMKFGPHDGFLYVALGDGGTALDRVGNAQSLSSLLGKILRIDVDNGDPYAIPDSNPFAADRDSRGEIWVLGLRNPWRISFDSLNGDLYIGDVGEEAWEEIDFLPADSSGGENFGWPCMEGPVVLDQNVCDPTATYVAPIFSYEHFRHCGSVIGGYVYRGSSIPEMAGHYVLADLCRGTMWGLYRNDQGEWLSNGYDDYGKNFTTFGERVDGELFLGALYNANIYHIVGYNS